MDFLEDYTCGTFFLNPSLTFPNRFSSTYFPPAGIFVVVWKQKAAHRHETCCFIFLVWYYSDGNEHLFCRWTFMFYHFGVHFILHSRRSSHWLACLRIAFFFSSPELAVSCMYAAIWSEQITTFRQIHVQHWPDNNRDCTMCCQSDTVWPHAVGLDVRDYLRWIAWLVHGALTENKGLWYQYHNITH